MAMISRSRRVSSSTEATNRSIQRYCSREEAGSMAVCVSGAISALLRRLSSSGMPSTSINTSPVSRFKKLDISGELRSNAVSRSGQTTGTGFMG
jgi:hypothetical protein